MILIGEPTSANAARRHDQDRAARLGQHVDRGPGRAGPRRLSRTGPTTRSRRWLALVAALDAVHLDDGSDAVPALEPRIHRHRSRRRAPATSFPAWRQRAAQHPLQQSPARRRSGDAWSSRSRSARRRARRVTARDLGRGVPDAAGPALRRRRRRDREETGDRARAVDQRRHVGRPLPDQAVPGGRFRPAQRDDAQGGRMRGARGDPSAAAGSTDG